MSTNSQNNIKQHIDSGGNLIIEKMPLNAGRRFLEDIKKQLEESISKKERILNSQKNCNAEILGCIHIGLLTFNEQQVFNKIGDAALNDLVDAKTQTHLLKYNNILGGFSNQYVSRKNPENISRIRSLLSGYFEADSYIEQKSISCFFKQFDEKYKNENKINLDEFFEGNIFQDYITSEYEAVSKINEEKTNSIDYVDLNLMPIARALYENEDIICEILHLKSIDSFFSYEIANEKYKQKKNTYCIPLIYKMREYFDLLFSLKSFIEELNGLIKNNLKILQYETTKTTLFSNT